MNIVAVLTIPVEDSKGRVTTCNMVEALDISLGRIKERFDNLKESGYNQAGEIILNFVKIDE